MKRLLDKLQAVPHLFAKGMVLWCVICGTAATGLDRAGEGWTVHTSQGDFESR